MSKNKDPLLPDLQILDKSVAPERQQCMLRPTREAKNAQYSTVPISMIDPRRKEDEAIFAGIFSH